ncbi:MAG TPA: hypothetical protein VKY73_01710 [Polyangiaceae bacterium]|nr:hypothetical protein [Polyangiaceae bacterium]
METRSELLTRALCETLDSILSPTARDALLREALALSGRNDVPLEPETFRAFIAGPLASALERALGTKLGGSVTVELERATARLLPRAGLAAERAPGSQRSRMTTIPASRSARLRRRSSNPPADRVTPVEKHPVLARTTLPSGVTPHEPTSATRMKRAESIGRIPTVPARPSFTEPSGPNSGDRPVLSWALDYAPPSTPDRVVSTARRLPLVLVSTRDPELVQRFAAWLDPRAAVVRVSRLTDLLVDLGEASQRRTLIVLDCREPLVRPQSLAGLADELPAAVRVVLWGATRELERALFQISPATARWVVCSPEMTESDVVERCAEMVG